MSFIKDQCQFETVFNEYWELLYKAAYSRIPEQSVVEDILQEIFIDLWQRRSDIKIRTNLKVYLLTAVKYRVLKHMDQVRKRQDKELQGIDVPSIQNDILAFEELYQQLEVVMEKLPPKCRLVFEMSRLDGLSASEISEKLNISPQTVHNHLTKSLSIVRKEMKQVTSY